MRTLSIPEIAAIRPRLVPEHAIYGSYTDDGTETVVSGVADAVAYDVNGHIDTNVDWKSEVDVTPDRLKSYRGQLKASAAHRRATRFPCADDV